MGLSIPVTYLNEHAQYKRGHTYNYSIPLSSNCVVVMQASRARLAHAL